MVWVGCFSFLLPPAPTPLACARARAVLRAACAPPLRRARAPPRSPPAARTAAAPPAVRTTFRGFAGRAFVPLRAFLRVCRVRWSRACPSAMFCAGTVVLISGQRSVCYETLVSLGYVGICTCRVAAVACFRNNHADSAAILYQQHDMARRRQRQTLRGSGHQQRRNVSPAAVFSKSSSIQPWCSINGISDVMRRLWRVSRWR